MQATRILITGLVQGVGFRPAVYRVATRMDLTGWVQNTISGVEVVLNTPSGQDFLHNLNESLPPLAKIDTVTETLIELSGIPEEFIIKYTNYADATGLDAIITPDISTCKKCIQDIFNPQSRYYLYPFTSCSDCGARYTIIHRLPYRRENTTMREFPLCARCQHEFTNLNDRRYYAETMCCPTCGPQLELGLESIATQIKNGAIVALKTTGGYVLITDANNISTITKLRQRKKRPYKPFALMALNTQSIQEYYCEVSKSEQNILESTIAPLVILQQKLKSSATTQEIPTEDFQGAIAPGLNTLAFMLPSNPIYYLLFYYLLGKPRGNEWLGLKNRNALIITSANLSGGNIISENNIAKTELALIADIIVGYDRNIIMQNDDSVVRLLAENNIVIRQARGLAPRIYRFNYNLPQVLGVGAHLKNTVCFANNNKICVSQYIGDMDAWDNIQYFNKVISHFQQVFNFSPEHIVSDLHPDFYTSSYASGCKVSHLQLQHHYAHMASMLANLQSQGQVLAPNILGCILDGYGYGIDGGAWGGELIKFESANVNFTQISQLPVITTPSGDGAKFAVWKIALAWCLENSLPVPKHILLLPQMDAVSTLIKNNYVSTTNSMGQLFSLVSSLLGICCYNSYEAEAALRLESLVTKPEFEEEYVRLTITGKPDIQLLLRRIYHIAYNDGSIIRAVNIFYGNLALLLGKWIMHHAQEQKITQVVLGGGCWQSKYLLPLIKERLHANQIKLLLPQWLSFNDESISLGQAWFGAQYVLREKTGV